MILKKLAHNILTTYKKKVLIPLPYKYLCIKLNTYIFIGKKDVLENLIFLQGRELSTITKIINNFFLLDAAFYMSKSILLLPGRV